jgi:hypothetical protein
VKRENIEILAKNLSHLPIFDSPWKKKRFLAKKKTHNEKNFVILLVQRRAFSRERGKKKTL